VKNKNDIVVNDDLIAKYLGGEANPEEAEAILDWLEEGENQAYFERIQATWDIALPSKATVPFNKNAAWESVQQNLGPVSRESSNRLWFKIAAGLIVGLSASIVGYFLSRQTTVPSQISVVTKKDTKNLRLPDNSTVVINRHSTISYPEGFGKKNREVHFSGEGFFSVERNESVPFIIHTTVGDIKVVGTEFNVSQAGNALEVNVEEGKVLVYTSTDSAYLESGQSARMHSGEPISIINSIDANQWGYASRRFVFEDVPLSEVFERIEKAYPYSIEVSDENIKNCRLTTTFDHKSVREMLNLIGDALDFTIQENDSTFRVEGKGCPSIQ
jgi:ferric-dicitrate binding protein FerR (iron transport regulator)